MDFYSKQEMAIEIDPTSRYPIADNDIGEFFIYSCYALRTLSNFGSHDIGVLLAIMMATMDEDNIERLIAGFFDLPERMKLAYLSGHNFRTEYSIIRDYLSGDLIGIVDGKGRAKKVVIATLPPFNVKLNGFGLLGLDINYFGFHSVLGLFKYLIIKHKTDKNYLENILKITKSIGNIQLAGNNNLDQVGITNQILEKLGIV